MNLFQFMSANKSQLGQILDKIDDMGEILIEPSDFDFSVPDVNFEFFESEDTKTLVFSLALTDDIVLRTTIDPDDFSTYEDALKQIKDPNTRIEIVRCLEDTFNTEAQGDVEAAELKVRNATTELQEAEEVRKKVTDMTVSVKQAWGIR